MPSRLHRPIIPTRYEAEASNGVEEDVVMDMDTLEVEEEEEEDHTA